MVDEAGRGTATTRIRRLEAENADLQGQAKEELLTVIRRAIGDLNKLGHAYRFVGTRGGGRTVNVARGCPVCKFRTVPHHDARSHRGQGRKKRAFTSDEFNALGLARR